MGKSYFLTGYLLIVLLGFVVGETVIANFTDAKLIPSSEFQSGTVDIAVYKTAGGETEITPGQASGSAAWSVTNTGTKAIILRAEIIEELQGTGDEDSSETAWAVGTSVYKDTPEGDISPRFGGGNARYNLYKLSSSKKEPLVLKLGYGAEYLDSGSVYIWNDGADIFVDVETKEGWILEETHLYVASSIPTNSAPGQLGNELQPMSNSVSYQLPIPDKTQGNTVYIALHAAIVKGPSGDVDAPIVDFTVSGWTKGDDGYYYYCDPIAKGGNVEFKADFEVTGSWSGEYKLYLEVQAVQASNNAIESIWPDSPCTTSE